MMNNNMNPMMQNNNNMMMNNNNMMNPNMMNNNNNMNTNIMINNNPNFINNINNKNNNPGNYVNVSQQMNNQEKYIPLYNQLQKENDIKVIQNQILNALNLNNNVNQISNNSVGGNEKIFYTSSEEQINPNLGGEIINVIFKTSQGNFHKISLKPNETIGNMITKFLDKFELNDLVLKQVIFIHNATNLNSLDPSKLISDNEVRIRNGAIVNVLDTNNVIGA